MLHLIDRDTLLLRPVRPCDYSLYCCDSHESRTAMQITNFSEIESEFIQRVHTMVWCSVATIDSQQRPRSRILHPIWEGATGWILTHPTSHKARHLARSSYVSLAYITDVMKPVYADCRAAWIDDLDQKKRVWELFKTAPEPLGYDP